MMNIYGQYMWLMMINGLLKGFPARHGGTPEMDGKKFTKKKNHLEMDDKNRGTPMTKRNPPHMAW